MEENTLDPLLNHTSKHIWDDHEEEYNSSNRKEFKKQQKLKKIIKAKKANTHSKEYINARKR